MKKIRFKTAMASASRWLDQICLHGVEAISVVGALTSCCLTFALRERVGLRFASAAR